MVEARISISRAPDGRPGLIVSRTRRLAVGDHGTNRSRCEAQHVDKTENRLAVSTRRIDNLG